MEPMSDHDDSADGLRSRLVALDDEIRLLARDDFAGRRRLNVERDRLRGLLRERRTDADDNTTRAWAERAGRKGSHAEPTPEGARAAIISPGEMGGGSSP